MPRTALFTTLAAVLIAGTLLVLGAFPQTAEGPEGGAPGYEPASEQAPVTGARPAREVLVRFRSSADAGERADARKNADTKLEETLPVSGLQLVDPEPGVTTSEAIDRLERSDDVLYAEPDVARAITAKPSDRLFDYQWGLHSTGQSVNGSGGTVDADIDAPEAWDVTTGSAGITIGVIDTGVDQGHPDLAPNGWRNPGETGSGRESNSRDDDGNGLVDDFRGWDWVDGDNNPTDENGHGTHVAGTAAARGNDGEGVAGVAWNAGVLPLRVLGADGTGRVSDVIKAYAYAGRKSIRIVNASLGGGDSSQAERDAIAAAPSTLFVVAAGNEGADNDATASFPCNYPVDNVVCVAASDRNDALAGFSNYGARNVDLAAPGVDIASTWLNDEWVLLDGTSMATPMVAGTAALVWARQPAASVSTVRDALLRNTDPVPALSGRTVTGGRLNAYRAVTGVDAAAARIATPDSAAPAPAPSSPSPAPAPSSPAPTPAPGTARDTSAPSLRVSLGSSTKRTSTILSQGLRPRVTCGEACTLRESLVIGKATVKRLRLGSGRRELTIGSMRSGISRKGSKTVIVRISSSRVRSALRRSRSVSAVLRTSATDPAGNVRRSSRTITLRR